MLLADEFLKRYSREIEREFPGFANETRRWMLQYQWPGNVRELQNNIQRAVVLGEPGLPLALELFTGPRSAAGNISEKHGGTLREILDSVESTEVQRALRESDGVVSQAARQLGVSRQHLHNLIRKHDLKGRTGPKRQP